MNKYIIYPTEQKINTINRVLSTFKRKPTKKLRLLLTEHCSRNCEGCCNKDWNLSALPVVQSFGGYSVILLTGGEPMEIMKNKFEEIMSWIWLQKDDNAKMILYTAKVTNHERLINLLHIFLDGLTVTIHESSDIRDFIRFAYFLNFESFDKPISLRVNVFKPLVLPQKKFFYKWKIKEMEWLKDCPLPKDEVFMRYTKPLTKE